MVSGTGTCHRHGILACMHVCGIQEEISALELVRAKGPAREGDVRYTFNN